MLGLDRREDGPMSKIRTSWRGSCPRFLAPEWEKPLLKLDGESNI
jgi:hypothetical protein